MPGKWKHVMPTMTLGQIQGVAAKKHVTVFLRSTSAPGAGSPEQKMKFSRCAASTKGVHNRTERNMMLSNCLGGKRSSSFRPGGGIEFGRAPA